MIRKTKYLSLVFINLILLSCQDNPTENQALTTDLINNPSSASGVSSNGNLPIFQFEEEVFDFDSITQGEKISHSFKFRNIGKADLIITASNGSCGCTVAEYPKNPIAPGSEGKIDIVFNSEGKSGRQHKTVTVLANTNPASTVLTLTGGVIEPKK